GGSGPREGVLHGRGRRARLRSPRRDRPPAAEGAGGKDLHGPEDGAPGLRRRRGRQGRLGTRRRNAPRALEEGAQAVMRRRPSPLVLVLVLVLGTAASRAGDGGPAASPTGDWKRTEPGPAACAAANHGALGRLLVVFRGRGPDALKKASATLDF